MEVFETRLKERLAEKEEKIEAFMEQIEKNMRKLKRQGLWEECPLIHEHSEKKRE